MKKEKNTKLNVYSLFGDYGRYGEQVSESTHFKVLHSSYLFENYVSIQDIHHGKFGVNKNVLHSMVRSFSNDDYDLVYCGDSSEALLLQYVMKKQGVPHKSFLINDVDVFEKAKRVDLLILRYYRESFLDEFIASIHNHWFYTAQSRYQEYKKSGIQDDNLHYIPLSFAAIQLFFSKMSRTMMRCRDNADRRGHVLSSGSHDRDYGLLVQALHGLNVPVDIICNLDVYQPVDAEHIFWHDSLPEEEYIRKIRSARYVVLPLKSTGGVAGQLNCSIAMYFGKAVIAPACESLDEYLVNNETGLLYEQGNMQSLREKIKFAEQHGEEIIKMGEKASKTESCLSKIAAGNIRKLAKRLKSSVVASKTVLQV